MQMLEKHGITHLLGEIVAADLIDAIDNPVAIRDLANFVESDSGKRLRRISNRNRRARARAGGEIVDV
jgi:hypothetical protein